MNNSKIQRKNTGIINPSKEIEIKKEIIEPEPLIENLDFENDDEIIEQFFVKLSSDMVIMRDMIEQLKEAVSNIREDLDKKEDKKIIEF